MPQAEDIPGASLGLAVGLSLIALFLGLRQWYERKARESVLSPADQLHYGRQDTRRWAGVGTLLAIAVLALAGSRIQPGPAGRPNLVFLALWFVVLALIMVLLGLALADLLATRSFARCHRKQLIRESIEAIRQEARRRLPSSEESLEDSQEPPSTNRTD